MVNVSKSLWGVTSEFQIHTELSMTATVAVSGIGFSMSDIMESRLIFVELTSLILGRKTRGACMSVPVCETNM